MRPSLRPIFLAPLFSLLLAGCPTEVGVQCPPNTVSIGQFTLNIAGVTDAGNACVATQPDGGGTTPLTPDGGSQLGGTFCLGTGGSDGGPRIGFLASGKDPRYSDLLTDGGFHFAGHSDPIAGTACVCPVAIDDSFDGYLQTTPLGPIALQADGGLPLITRVSAAITDNLSTDAGTSGCLCALPCSVTWSVTGSRF